MTLEGLNYRQRQDYGARDRQKFSVLILVLLMVAPLNVGGETIRNQRVVFTIKCRQETSHHGLENELRALVAQAQKRRRLPGAIRTSAPRLDSLLNCSKIETDKRPFAGFVPNPGFDWQTTRTSFAPETTSPKRNEHARPLTKMQ
ncbi:MAG: hypothetical protein QOK03_2608 [Candidatus Binataceae bacterium]|jgi:hypothetical protein|nr:hypothetical protein [Candidatus Binataceae bacterium]